MRRLPVVTGGVGQRNHVAFVQATSKNTAIERLDSLGVIKPGGQAAGQIHGDVVAAQRKPIGVNKAAIGEYCHRGGACTNIDDCGAYVSLVVGQCG